MHLNDDLRLKRPGYSPTEQKFRPVSDSMGDALHMAATSHNIQPAPAPESYTIFPEPNRFRLDLAPDQIITLIRYEVEKLQDAIKPRSGHSPQKRRFIEDRAHEIAKLVAA